MNENPSQPYSPVIDHALERRLDNLPGGDPERYTGFRGSFRLEMDKLFSGMKVKKKIEAQKPKMDQYVITCRAISELTGELKRLGDRKTNKRVSYEKNAKIRSLEASIRDGLEVFEKELFIKYEKSLVQAANEIEQNTLRGLWENFEQNYGNLLEDLQAALEEYEKFSNSNADGASRAELRKMATALISASLLWQGASVTLRKNIEMYFSGKNS
jgi:hypothetical protein